jgi:WhiB family redox-sensing transcriptional regulator
MEIDDIDMTNAACKSADPELFFAEVKEREKIADAKSYCDRCPIVMQCLTYALNNEEFGIWGGTTMAERLLVKNNPRARKELIIKVTTK